MRPSGMSVFSSADVHVGTAPLQATADVHVGTIAGNYTQLIAGAVMAWGGGEEGKGTTRRERKVGPQEGQRDKQEQVQACFCGTQCAAEELRDILTGNTRWERTGEYRPQRKNGRG